MLEKARQAQAAYTKVPTLTLQTLTLHPTSGNTVPYRIGGVTLHSHVPRQPLHLHALLRPARLDAWGSFCSEVAIVGYYAGEGGGGALTDEVARPRDADALCADRTWQLLFRVRQGEYSTDREEAP